MDIYGGEVTELPAWDPMGALARNRVTEVL